MIASNPKCTPNLLANLRAAFAAARAGQGAEVPQFPQIVATRDWLSIVVLRAAAKETGQQAALQAALQDRTAGLPTWQLAEIAILQRALHPRNPLGAAHWFQHTALPLIYGVSDDAVHDADVERAVASVADKRVRSMLGVRSARPDEILDELVRALRRNLQERMRAAGRPMSGARLLEALHNGRLCEFADGQRVVVNLDGEKQEILAALGWPDIAEQLPQRLPLHRRQRA